MGTIETGKWFERSFVFDLAVEQFPLIVERLRGTPARLEERTCELPEEQLTRNVEGNWSVQENVGHLLDLEPLWSGRIEDIYAGAEYLRPADLNNTATHNANHNQTPMNQLLSLFRKERKTLVSKLDQLTRSEIEAFGLHPRLQQPMRAIDLAFFVAEHDDHHLATITAILHGN